MKCTKCGAELVPEAKFCNVCGEAAVREIAPAPLAPEMVTTPVETPSFDAAGPLPSLDIVEEETSPSIIESVPVAEENQFVEEPAPVEVVPTEPETEAVAPVVEEVTPVTEPVVVEEPTPVEPEPVAPTPIETPVSAEPVNQATPKSGINPAIIAVVLLLLVVAVGGGVFAGKALFGAKENKKEDKPKVEVIKTKVSHAGREYEIPDEYDYTIENGILIIEVSDDLAYGITSDRYQYSYYESTVNKIQNSCNKNIASGCKLEQKKDKYVFLRYEQEVSDYHFFKIEGAIKTDSGDGIFISIAKMSEDINDADIKVILDIVKSSKITNNIYRNTQEDVHLSEILKGVVELNSLEEETEAVENTLDVIDENPIENQVPVE